jgi:hypothetical protein
MSGQAFDDGDPWNEVVEAARELDLALGDPDFYWTHESMMRGLNREGEKPPQEIVALLQAKTKAVLAARC